MKAITPPAGWLAMLLAVVPLLLYGPLLLDHYYIWDDWLLFVNDPALRVPETLLERAFEPVLWNSSYLRPLVMASFGVELIAFGNDPLWPHLFNLGLHVLNCLLVFSVALGVISANPHDRVAAPLRAALAALVYAVHPALVESTAWISGRFDLMVSTFMLAALAVLVHARGWRRDFGFAACFALALMCKEMAITLPAIAAAIIIWKGDGAANLWQSLRQLAGRPWWRMWSLVLAVVVAYFLMRWAVLGSITGRLDAVNVGIGVLHRVALTGWALVFYLRGTWLPFFNAAPLYPIRAADFDTHDLVVGTSVSLAVLAGVLALVVRRPRHALGLGLAAWAVALLPVLHLVPLPISENVGHDRFLTFPLALWALMFTRLGTGPAAAGGVRWPRVVALPLLCWVLAAMASVRNSVPVWANDLSLWSWAHEKNPNSREVNNNLLVAANRFGMQELAQRLVDANVGGGVPEFEINKAIFEIGRNDARAALTVLELLERDMGSPHADLSQPESYLDGFRAPQKTYEALPRLYSTKAEAYFLLEDYAMTLRMSRIALLYQPNSPVALTYRALALYGLERWEEAERAYELAFALEPKVRGSRLPEVRRHLLDKLCRKEVGGRACGALAEVKR